jgi:two-component sensor histidine kinase
MLITPKSYKLKELLFSTVLLFVLEQNAAQDFHYIEFTTKDGLAGNTVYDMCQDKDGFLWFATEAGVSRYDGNSFSNYTTKDGLPDNEVLKIYGDSQGRIWMSPFKNELCFFKAGKIYNRNNCELLKKISLTSFILGFAEDNHGNLMFNDSKNIYFLSVTDSLIKLPITGQAVIRKNYFKPGFRIVNNDSVFDYDFPTLIFKRKEDNSHPLSISISIKEDDENLVYHPFPGIINLTYSGTQLRYVTTIDGCYRVNRSKDGLDRIYHFLPGKKVLKAIEDEEGFLWISVPGEGVYKLTSTQITSLLTLNSREIGEIHTLVKYRNTIVAGCDDGVLHFIAWDLKSGYTKDYYSLRKESFRPSDIMRAYCSKLLSNGSCLIGFDAFLLKLHEGGETVKYTYPAKSIIELPGDRFVLATALQVVRGRTSDLKIIDTITNERATSVLSVGNDLYIGTLSGLNLVKGNSSTEFLGKENTLLRSKISDLKEDASGIIWIGTNNTGLIGLKNNKVVYHITEGNGLSSNIIQCLTIDSNVLWAGTNKGINKVSFKKGVPGIAIYSYANGIASDMVTALMVDDRRVYAGTSAGLSVFDKHFEIQAAAPRLRLLNIVAGENEVDRNKSFEVGYKERIKIDFTALSFSDHAGTYFVYKLHGYSEKPDTTSLSHIEFTSLPGQSYILELKAVSASGKSSATISIPFRVNSPFWEKRWFIISTVLISILLGWSIIFLWLRIRNRRRDRINFYQREIMELRQKAVLAKMNPHFIFNSLNTLQDYIINKDFIAVNKLLVGISSLIRQTLENSFKATISIKEEIRYLSTYLEIEQMRFENKFQYSISTTTKDLDRMNNAEIPTLIIQPFVENAVRHGIGSLENEDGCINIKFYEKNGRVMSSVTDNGIGIVAHRKRMAQASKEYISRGTLLVEELIKTIEISTGRKIEISVEDLAEQGIAGQHGTQVTISF